VSHPGAGAHRGYADALHDPRPPRNDGEAAGAREPGGLTGATDVLRTPSRRKHHGAIDLQARSRAERCAHPSSRASAARRGISVRRAAILRAPASCPPRDFSLRFAPFEMTWCERAVLGLRFVGDGVVCGERSRASSLSFGTAWSPRGAAARAGRLCPPSSRASAARRGISVRRAAILRAPASCPPRDFSLRFAPFEMTWCERAVLGLRFVGDGVVCE
jgi:hypothetical protein